VKRRHRLAGAVVVGIAAFLLYRATLLPGLDLGDTASFQATIGSPIITPRDGYPLYLALGNLALWTSHAEPAHALNLASAVEGALACALLVLAAAELSGSVLTAVAAASLFAVSYTFWSQAIIAEVYALHMIFVSLTLWLVLRWSKHPTTARLTLVFLVYAIGFGNHLSMVLLAPGVTLFLLLGAPGGWRSMVRPRVVGLATACALVGALQYTWNLHALWLQAAPPRDLLDAFSQFWFDVTKTDWRETMVMRVPQVMLGDHAAMYAFDLDQQFGWIAPVIAALGLVQLARTDWRRAVLVSALYLVNVLFAFSYNVGDTHVFYLPSHLFVALLTAPGLVLLGNAVRQPQLAAALFGAYVVARGWRDYPALDRSRDTRPTAVLAALTEGLDDRHAVLLTDLNWQLENGLTYFARVTKPGLAHIRMPAVLLYAPALIASNADINRDVVVTEAARETISSAYGPLYRLTRDARVETPSLSSVARIPAGTRYALCLLKPTGGQPWDWIDIGAALSALTGGREVHVPDGDYVVIAGISGRPPSLLSGSNRPFRQSLVLDDVAVDIRMESWLAADTIRRMGFGQIIAAHRHTLIVERGASFVAFDASGLPLRTAYASSLFAPQARYLIGR
jgi:hypothetical protein